jgi:hypothetical protein
MTPLVLINGQSKSGTYGVWAKGATLDEAKREFSKQGGGLRRAYTVLTFPAGEPRDLRVGPMGVRWDGADVPPIIEDVASKLG